MASDGTSGPVDDAVAAGGACAPSFYILRINPRTGKEIPGAIEPHELLVESYRDRHPADVAAQFLASRMVQLTGDDRSGWQLMRRINRLGQGLARVVGSVTGSAAVERGVKLLIGVPDTQCCFRFRPVTLLGEHAVAQHLHQLQRAARGQLRQRGTAPALQLLVTGATGFVGQEILLRTAADARVVRVVCVLRPETVRDRRTRGVTTRLTAEQRGIRLLHRLGISGAAARKFRFVDGDIERPGLGMHPVVVAHLRATLTHVIHTAASVSFDKPYDISYRANVLGNRHVLEFSLGCQAAAGSAFVAHLAIETSYVHGRAGPAIARETALVFPHNFYNNYYELTKAMATIDTERFMIERGLRVVQLLPSIIIGDSRTGNNHGDTKVINAPVNAVGRAKPIIHHVGRSLTGVPKAWLLARMTARFPGDPSAELNLVPIDRVVAGILAALTTPEAIGQRIHLVSDDRIRADVMADIAAEEIGIGIRLTDPTLFRTLAAPVRSRALRRLRQPKLARAAAKVAAVFGAYGEWGQPIHDVGNDVRVLGLPLHRPNIEHAFRMLCRHNRYVQRFGKVRDADEVARRERVWSAVINHIEGATGHEVATIPVALFRELLKHEIDTKTFTVRAERT